jgi:hypothetical protein
MNCVVAFFVHRPSVAAKRNMQSKVSRRQQLRWLGACVALVSWNAFFTAGFQNDFNIDFALRARLEYFRRRVQLVDGRIQWVLKEFRGPFLEHVTLGNGVIPQHNVTISNNCTEIGKGAFCCCIYTL